MWISDLTNHVSQTQHSNQISIEQVTLPPLPLLWSSIPQCSPPLCCFPQLQRLLNLSSRQHHHELNPLTLSTLGSNRLLPPPTTPSTVAHPSSVSMNAVREAIQHLQEKSSSHALSSQDILELFSNLFGQDQWRQQQQHQLSSPRNLGAAGTGGSGGGDDPRHGGMSESSNHSSSDPDEVIIDPDGTKYHRDTPPPPRKTQRMELPDDEMNPATAMIPSSSSSTPRSRDQMENVLELLRKVNFVLEQLSLFWSNTEIVLDLLSKKGQHAEQFVGFAHNPKLLSRFKDRLSEYRSFVILPQDPSFPHCLSV
jgi:hypothetical protein